MSTNEPEHYADAKQWAEAAEGAFNSDADRAATQMAAIGQLHATLALVDQLRALTELLTPPKVTTSVVDQLAEFLETPVRIRFWTCPVREHRDRRDAQGMPVVTVEWDENGIAHCTASGCENTSAPKTEEADRG